MSKRPFWSKAGEGPTYPNSNVPRFSPGDNTMGNDAVLATHNNDRGSRIPDRGPEKTAFHRGHTQAEANGARLSISPSMKIPTNDPASGYNRANTRLVSSRGGNFRQGIRASEQL